MFDLFSPFDQLVLFYFSFDKTLVDFYCLVVLQLILLVTSLFLLLEIIYFAEVPNLLSMHDYMPMCLASLL